MAADIILSTLNARYSHAALGLRYLQANLGALAARSQIAEFVIGRKGADIVERLLAQAPRIIGFGVYIWNVEEITHIVALLKRIAPEVLIVLGGPEVSHEGDEQPLVGLADYTISGWGEVSFATLCAALLEGARPAPKHLAGLRPPLAQLTLPYALYSATDIARRNLYVEASRGCPFKCEFCLSALDKTAWPFPPDAFLAELAALYARGARRFKFVDRTFNLDARCGARILDFFLARAAEQPDDPPFAHFELVPDHLPASLKARISQAPPGLLQLEIGIQSFNPQVQARISRRQDNAAAEANLRWLRTHSNAHLHVDLIIGLPGETLESIAAGFDRLVALAPHEIQVGILKRLRGTPIVRHSAEFAMRYDPRPPYALLQNSTLDFATMQRLSRFARYWDLIANSGRFAHSLPRLLGDAPFGRFLAFADWLYVHTDATGGLAPERLARLLAGYLDGTPLAADEIIDADPAPAAAPRRATPARQRRHAPDRVKPARHHNDTGL